MAFLFWHMPSKIPHRKKTVQYWNAQARWQKTWLEHGHYHQDIIPLITARTTPGWRVLDIGAGSGVLALPLWQKGCEVTALEPSQGMRALLREAAGHQLLPGLRIEASSWEELPLAQARDFHLILACNSLHLTSLEINLALAKAFQAQPQHVCLVTELDFLSADLPRHYHNFRLTWSRYLETDSSFAYHHLDELWEHHHHQEGRILSSAEKDTLKTRLVHQDGHYWLKNRSLVGLFWWSPISGH